MTITYKNAKSAALSDSLADIYTCPAATSAIVSSIFAANIDGSNTVILDVVWTDDSDSGTATYLCKEADITVAQISLELLDRSKILEAGDKIRAKATAASDIALTIAIAEVS